MLAAFWLAAGRRRRGPAWRPRPLDAAEGVFSLLLLIALFPIALWAYDPQLVKMRAIATEALALSIDQEICMQESWVVTGELPAASSCTYRDPSHGLNTHYVTAVVTTSNQPAFDYVFGNKDAPTAGPRLTVTLMAGPGEPPETLLWRCGSAQIASGMKALAEDRTTLAWRALPSSCRARTSNVSRR